MSKKVLQKSRAFETKWFSVDELHYSDVDGAYYRINVPSGAVVLPITPEGNFVLIRQYRPVLGKYTLEFPAGGVAPGEPPEEAVRREMYEETGYTSEQIELVGTGVIRLDREDAENYFFIAKDAKLNPGFQPLENIEPIELTPMEFKRVVMDDEFAHIAALPIFLFAEWNNNLKLI